MTQTIEILVGTPNGDVVEYGPDDDEAAVEAAAGDEWRVDWATPAYKLASERWRSPIFRQATLTFGCADPSLGYEAWQSVFAGLAAHLKAVANEDLHDNSDWQIADEGCQIAADVGRIEAIRAAIESFDGPIAVYESVPDDAEIVLNDEGYPVIDEAVRS
jgi:hypothetical protein